MNGIVRNNAASSPTIFGIKGSAIVDLQRRIVGISSAIVGKRRCIVGKAEVI